jgi:uncharacterized repeat protein (TIGR04138 family)
LEQKDKMGPQAEKSVADVSQELGRYPMEAFEFLHQGLDYTVQRIHGPPPPGLTDLHEWLRTRDSEPPDLGDLLAEGEVPAPFIPLIDHLGGVEAAVKRMNRHIGGEALCWGLRDLALKQWGLMAAMVLRHWGVRCTKDFGRMVFALVESGLLQKQPHDRIEDFDHVFDFEQAFDKSFKVRLTSCSPRNADSE